MQGVGFGPYLSNAKFLPAVRIPERPDSATAFLSARQVARIKKLSAEWTHQLKHNAATFFGPHRARLYYEWPSLATASRSLGNGSEIAWYYE